MEGIERVPLHPHGMGDRLGPGAVERRARQLCAKPMGAPRRHPRRPRGAHDIAGVGQGHKEDALLRGRPVRGVRGGHATRRGGRRGGGRVLFHAGE